MISLQDIRQKYKSIREQIEKSIFDSYLLQYIKTPIIDEDKLLILISIMDRLELSPDKMQNFALSTMFIQIALDTHEHISNTVKDEKGRQLTVLAGDYYSGLYYKLLAESEDNLLIKELSRGIKEINEHKIGVYQKDIDGIDKLITSMRQIESSLLAKFSEYFKVDLWNDFIGNLFLFKRLLSEKNQYLKKESSVFFDALKEVIFPKISKQLNDLSSEQQSHLLQTCDYYLEQTKKVIEKGLEQLPYLNDLLEQRINLMLNQYKPYAKSFVEEG